MSWPDVKLKVIIFAKPNMFLTITVHIYRSIENPETSFPYMRSENINQVLFHCTGIDTFRLVLYAKIN